MADGISREFDPEQGHLRLSCDAAQFERLTACLFRETGGTIDVGPSDAAAPGVSLRVVSVELVNPPRTPAGLGHPLAGIGCAALCLGMLAVFLVGLATIMRWLIG